MNMENAMFAGNLAFFNYRLNDLYIWDYPEKTNVIFFQPFSAPTSPYINTSIVIKFP